MTNITGLNESDNGAISRGVINTNLDNLNNDKLETGDIVNKQNILSEGAFVNGDKTKLDNIEENAEVNRVDSVNAKTGAVTLDKTDIGLNNVDNTSDLNKPISNDTQTALDGKANKDGETITNASVNGVSLDSTGSGTNYLADDGTYKAVPGSQAVDSVNGKTGVVVLDTGDITEVTDKNYVTDTEKNKLSNVPTDTNAELTNLQTELDGKVDKTTAQTIAGVKTFSSSPIVPAPTTDLQVATKKYVDDNAGGGGFLREVDIAGTQLENTILFEGAIGKATTLEAGYITLLTAPTGSSFVITISKSTDSGTTYPTSETVTLTATNKYVKGTLTGAYAEGNFIKAEITQVGSTTAGQNLLFSVTGS